MEKKTKTGPEAHKLPSEPMMGQKFMSSAYLGSCAFAVDVDDVRHVGVGIALTAGDVADIADDSVAGDNTEAHDKAHEGKTASGSHFCTDFFFAPGSDESAKCPFFNSQQQ